MEVFLRMGKMIVGEDVALWPPVQQGLEGSEHRGVLIAREERVYAFQRFLCEKLGRVTPPTESQIGFKQDVPHPASMISTTGTSS